MGRDHSEEDRVKTAWDIMLDEVQRETGLTRKEAAQLLIRRMEREGKVP